MNEKFYFSRKCIRREVFAMSTMLLVLAAITPTAVHSQDLFFIVPVVLYFFGMMYTILSLTNTIDKPAVIITDEKIAIKSIFFGKREIKLDQIISVKVGGGCINIRYKKKDIKEKTHTINHIQTIENPERLAEFLEEKIKLL